MHANARLTFHGRCLLVERVLRQGRPRAHVAAEMGVSRQCAGRWVARYLTEGEDGLHDRSSRPHRCPSRIGAETEARVLALRAQHRRGQDEIGPELGVAPRTVSRILRRHRVPYLRELDSVTGEVIRASKTTAVRYERDRPGELVHMDVKKLGRVPDGGGWRVARPRRPGTHAATGRRHSDSTTSTPLVDDHSRLAYSEVLPDEKGTTCAGFLDRAAGYFAARGIPRIERVMTDNAWAYRSRSLRTVASRDSEPGRCSSSRTAPGSNGKVCEDWRRCRTGPGLTPAKV